MHFTSQMQIIEQCQGIFLYSIPIYIIHILSTILVNPELNIA